MEEVEFGAGRARGEEVTVLFMHLGFLLQTIAAFSSAGKDRHYCPTTMPGHKTAIKESDHKPKQPRRPTAAPS